MSTAPVLKFFNPDSPTEGEGDASEKGIGYSQIKKDLLPQVFGMEHNQQYVYGRKITLWTDHKPLEMIARKPVSCQPLKDYNVS